MHLDQMREFPFAGSSVFGPEIDDDYLSPLATDGLAEVGILDGAHRDGSVGRLASAWCLGPGSE
jgi:hypothetical protein